MSKALRLGVVYDFRNPPESGMRTQDLYAAVMDQVAWLAGCGRLAGTDPGGFPGAPRRSRRPIFRPRRSRS